ncbi:MAG: hypothetical protein IJN39_03030 [Clostridia bacterium]|nr:hypothetical protein [Clostridia bacterium]
MADMVRIDQQQCAAAVTDLRNKINQLRSYINSDVNSTVQSMSAWWIGDAYNSFRDDFEQTKQILEKQVIQELEDYISRLEKAVAAQAEQDISNAGSIGINN